MKTFTLMLGISSLVSGCDSTQPTASTEAGTESTSASAEADEAGLLPVTRLARPASWMPSDWDTDVYHGGGQLQEEDAILSAQQDMLATVPFTLWAVANDTLVTEAFQPIWVWYTALRSCERGIALSEDLAGEFGNRERGQAGLTKARKDLKDWAATQPKELTVYFSARLGQWNPESGAFPLQEVGPATTLRAKDARRFNEYHAGATVQLWSEGTRYGINHLQASLLAPQCASADGQMIHKFEKMSQWWVVFGDAERGMGGLVRYNSRAFLPPIAMSREEAAKFAQRNPERRVEVSITFAPIGSSFVQYTDQSTIRARILKATVRDALDDSVLAAGNYSVEQ